MTPDTVQLLARYNRHVNREMGRILAGLTDGEWNQAFGGYHASIRVLCSHVLMSDLAWLKRFATLRTFRYIQHPIFQRTLVWGDLLFPTFPEYEPDRKALDDVFVQFAEEVSSEDFPQRLRYKNFRGVDQDRELGGLILHAFNHQTHHRGMVSLYLDMLGKENDFSNLLPLV